MKLNKIILPILFIPIEAFSWSDHTFTTFYAIKNSKSSHLQEIVQAETIEKFLIDMKNNHSKELEKVIENTEQWAKQNMPGFYLIPKDIFYDSRKTNKYNIKTKFLKGISVNPNVILFPYVRDLPSSHINFSMQDYRKKNKALANLWSEANEINYKKVTLSFIHNSFVPGLRYYRIKSNQYLSAFRYHKYNSTNPRIHRNLFTKILKDCI